MANLNFIFVVRIGIHNIGNSIPQCMIHQKNYAFKMNKVNPPESLSFERKISMKCLSLLAPPTT